MHQRRDGFANRLPEHTAVIQGLLLSRWWTVRQLCDHTGLHKSTVQWCIQVLARTRVVFARRTTLPNKPRAYRVFPEAIGVRKG